MIIRQNSVAKFLKREYNKCKLFNLFFGGVKTGEEFKTFFAAGVGSYKHSAFYYEHSLAANKSYFGIHAFCYCSFDMCSRPGRISVW